MTVLALAGAPEPTPRREHASRSEYESWVRTTFPGARGTISSRLFFYKRFVERWPDLEEWFAAPLLVRLDLDADAAAGPGMRRGTSHEAGSYLAYLSLTHGMPMDADWVLARNFDSLFHPRVAPALGMNLDLLNTLDQRQQQLGYRSGRSALTWGVARLVLWKGDPDITAITHRDLVSFSEGIRRWSLLPEAGAIRAAHIHSTRRVHEPTVLVSQFEKACLSRLHSLHVLMFNTGQISEPPFHGLKTRELWREELTPADTPRPIAAPVNRWLAGRSRALTGPNPFATLATPFVTSCAGSARVIQKWPVLPS